MKRLLLAGAGHVHLEVLKAMGSSRWPECEVVLVSPYARQIYSGMLPGWIAGHYRIEQCAVELAALVEAAKLRFVEDRIVGLDAGRRVVRTARSGELSYDLLSLDTGAQIDVGELAATTATFLPIRPIEDFVAGWSAQVPRWTQRGRASVAVVGGGAAGVELALAARYRLCRQLGETKTSVTLVAGGGLLPGHGERIVRRVGNALKRHGVVTIEGSATGSPDGLRLADGTSVTADCVIAATGVKPAAWLAGCGLALAPDGFVAVQATQQSVSHAEVFAAGDIASRIDSPHAKSGVYAVRAGPVLAANLRRSLSGEVLQSYQPQKRTLYLLATGPKQAIMSWGGLSAEGRWVWAWKDWIDRRFVRQYVFDPGKNRADASTEASATKK